MTTARKTPIKLIDWALVRPLPMQCPCPEHVGAVTWTHARRYLNDPKMTLRKAARLEDCSVESIRRAVWRVYYVLHEDREYFSAPRMGVGYDDIAVKSRDE